MMDIHETCDSHFLLYARQIRLYTLNLFSAVGQLYFSKTGREKAPKMFLSNNNIKFRIPYMLL